MTRNYQVVYYVAQNVGIIGILAYPKNTHCITCIVLLIKIRGFRILNENI